MDKETLSLPNTPRSSFRQSVRKSLRKLKRRKKRQNNIAKKSSEGGGESKYEVKLAIKEDDEDEEDIYDVVEPVSIDPLDAAIENKVVVKEYSSRTFEKPTSIFDQKKSFQVSETNVTNNPSEVVDHKDIDSAQKDKESKLFPRGPLGDLLKQKSLNSDALKDQKCTNEADLETADEEKADKNVELEITDKEKEINEELRHPDSSGDEESKPEEEDSRGRKTLLAEGSHFLPDLSEISLSRSYFKLFVSFSGSEVERSLTPAVVIHPRRAVNRTELELGQGDIVFLHRRLNIDWYLGEKRGVIGLIPAAYIQ